MEIKGKIYMEKIKGKRYEMLDMCDTYTFSILTKLL